MSTAEMDARRREAYLRDTMRVRYSKGRMPHGDQKRLAREFNVSPKTVSAIAQSLEITQIIGRGPIRRLG